MKLLWDIGALVLGRGLRFSVALIALFAVSLSLTLAWPWVQRTRAALDDLPRLEAEAEQLRVERAERARAVDALDREATALRDAIAATDEGQRAIVTLHDSVDRARRAEASIRASIDARRRQVDQAARARLREACGAEWYEFWKDWACDAARGEVRRARAELDRWVAAESARVERLADEGRRAGARLQEWTGRLDGLGEAEALRTQLGEREAARDAARDALREAALRSAAIDERLDAARALRASTAGWLLDEFSRRWRTLALLLLLASLTPFLARAILWGPVMSLVARRPAMRLLDADAPGGIDAHPAERVARVQVRPGEALLARADWVRPVRAAASTQWFLDPRAPAISYAAGLFLLTRIEARTAIEPAQVALSAPGDDAADRYLARVDLADHPGLVLRPGHVVALTSGLRIETRWRLGSLHAWMTGRLRWILVRGTGSVWIHGLGDAATESLNGDARQERERALLAFDGRLALRTRRTETFVPYLLGRTPLVELELHGTGPMIWQKADGTSAARSVGERTTDAFLGALGKVLGF